MVPESGLRLSESSEGGENINHFSLRLEKRKKNNNKSPQGELQNSCGPPKKSTGIGKKWTLKKIFFFALKAWLKRENESEKSSEVLECTA